MYYLPIQFLKNKKKQFIYYIKGNLEQLCYVFIIKHVLTTCEWVGIWNSTYLVAVNLI